MTDAEWLACAEVLETFYPHNFRVADEVKLELWYQALMDLEGARVLAAVWHMVRTQPAFPSVADIRKHATFRLDPVEAWAEVLKAIGNSGTPEHQYYRPARGELQYENGIVKGGPKNFRLEGPRWSHPAVEKAVESIGGLMAVKTCRAGSLDRLRGQFIKAFEAFAATHHRQESFQAIASPALPEPRVVGPVQLTDMTARIGREIPNADL